MSDEHLRPEFRGILDRLINDHAGTWDALARWKTVDKNHQDGLWIQEAHKRNLFVYSWESPGGIVKDLVGNMKGVCRETLKSPLRFMLVPERANLSAGETILDIPTIPFAIDARKVYVELGGEFQYGTNDIVIGITMDGQAVLGGF